MPLPDVPAASQLHRVREADNADWHIFAARSSSSGQNLCGGIFWCLDSFVPMLAQHLSPETMETTKFTQNVETGITIVVSKPGARGSKMRLCRDIFSCDWGSSISPPKDKYKQLGQMKNVRYLLQHTNCFNFCQARSEVATKQVQLAFSLVSEASTVVQSRAGLEPVSQSECGSWGFQAALGLELHCTLTSHCCFQKHSCVSDDMWW